MLIYVFAVDTEKCDYLIERWQRYMSAQLCFRFSITLNQEVYKAKIRRPLLE
jgi:hypothetical protein